MKKMNQDGMSLVAVMVAMGLTGVLAVVIAQLMGDGYKSKNILEAKFEMIVIHNEIQDILRNTQNCTESLKSINAINGAGASISKLKYKAKNGTFLDKFLVDTLYNGEIKIQSYAINDSDPDVDVALEGSTHLLITYKVPNSSSLTKKIKIFVLVDAANKITKCSAAGSLQSGIGLSPGGKCITRTFEFFRTPGSGVVAGTPDSPSSGGTILHPSTKWSLMNVHCPSNFPLAMSAMVSAACWRPDEGVGYLHGADGSTIGATCSMMFIEDSGYPAANITNAKTTCDTVYAPATESYRRGACSITCCDF
jgi:type II secretory pathway pseudopilin PulG